MNINQNRDIKKGKKKLNSDILIASAVPLHFCTVKLYNFNKIFFS